MSKRSDTPPKQYNIIARVNHWLSAVTIFALFVAGWWMVDLDYYSRWYQLAPSWHKSIGIVLACLTLFRLLWKTFTPTPAIEGTPLERKVAVSVHHLVYLLLFAIFLSGYLISTSDGAGIQMFGWFTVPALGELFENQSDLAGEVHFYLACTLISLAVLHIAAALKHHFMDKDNTLRKMTGAIK